MQPLEQPYCRHTESEFGMPAREDGYRAARKTGQIECEDFTCNTDVICPINDVYVFLGGLFLLR